MRIFLGKAAAVCLFTFFLGCNPVVILGINLKEPPERVKPWAVEYNLTFPLLLDTKTENRITL